MTDAVIANRLQLHNLSLMAQRILKALEKIDTRVTRASIDIDERTVTVRCEANR